MDITQEFGGGRYLIRGYEAGRIRVNDEIYARSLIITPQYLNPEWPPQSLAELEDAHLESIIALEPEVVLLGTGLRLRFPMPRVMAFFRRHAVGIEAMNTAAACRTYNVLMSEGRSVAAALLIQ
jgi:uncharacterized protein